MDEYLNKFIKHADDKEIYKIIPGISAGHCGLLYSNGQIFDNWISWRHLKEIIQNKEWILVEDPNLTKPKPRLSLICMTD